MQFILKQYTTPADWDTWFIDGNRNRVFNYRLVNPHPALKEFLLTEQHGLCAYCQRDIRTSAKIEHTIPHSINQPLSTCYYNLVVVCNNSINDSFGKKHCDNSRGNMLLPPVIFHKDYSCPDGANYNYFVAEEDGSINLKGYGKGIDWNIWMQLRAFIDILNLNHDNLLLKRQDILTKWRLSIIGKPVAQQREFWKHEYDIINSRDNQPFRQFLLIYLRKKMGLVSGQ